MLIVVVMVMAVSMKGKMRKGNKRKRRKTTENEKKNIRTSMLRIIMTARGRRWRKRTSKSVIERGFCF